MTGQIKMANMPSIAKSINFNNVQIKDIEQNKCTISFELENYEENTPVFITLNNMTRKEITTAMNKVDTHYEYILDGLNSNFRYSFYLSAKINKNEFLSNIYSFTTIKTTVYGVRVDESISDPEAAVTYIDDAVGTTAAKNKNINGWADKFPFNKVRLVGLKNGKVVKEIKKEDKTKYIDGTTVSADVDVMVEIPKVYYESKIINDNVYEIRIAEAKFSSTCDCYAHKVCNIEKDNIYVGTYLGYVENGKLRSKSGVTPTTNTNLTQFRQYAQAVGNGYQLDNWHPLVLRKILYVLAYKSLDSQTVLGKGNTINTNSNPKATGRTNTRGLYYGSTNASEQVCFLGTEDFYGNLYQWVDGMYFDGTNIMVTPDNKTFNDNASGFKNLGSTPNLNTYGYVKNVVKTTEGLFFPSDINGSTTTYYSDYGSVRSGYFSIHGGGYSNGGSAGAFCLSVNCSVSESYSYVGGRLVYMGDELQINVINTKIYTGDNVEFNIHSDEALTELYVIKPGGQEIINIPINKDKKVYRLNDEEKFVFKVDGPGEYNIVAKSEKESTTFIAHCNGNKPSGGGGGKDL